MALCVNQSGTWREITTQCVNQSGTWRNIQTGCINQSGTWRCYGFFTLPSLGSSFGGGYVICVNSGVIWIVAPSSAEVSRNWYSRNDANTRAQQVSGCTGWFVPTQSQLVYGPGYICRTYWDSYSSYYYWSSTEYNGSTACALEFSANTPVRPNKLYTFCVRAFRCVSY